MDDALRSYVFTYSRILAHLLEHGDDTQIRRIAREAIADDTTEHLAAELLASYQIHSFGFPNRQTALACVILRGAIQTELMERDDKSYNTLISTKDDEWEGVR